VCNSGIHDDVRLKQAHVVMIFFRQQGDLLSAGGPLIYRLRNSLVPSASYRIRGHHSSCAKEVRSFQGSSVFSLLGATVEATLSSP